MGTKNVVIVAAAAALAVCGCKQIRVEQIKRTPVDNGTNGIIIVESVIHGEYESYGIENNLSGLSIDYSPTNGVHVAIDKVSYDMSKQHAEIVDKSLKGAAELAAKVGQAIAVAGGKGNVDAIGALVKKFVDAGGDASKAKIDCADGSCTISDGSISCSDGVCSPL